MSINGSSVRQHDFRPDAHGATIADVILTLNGDDTIVSAWTNEARPVPETESWVGRTFADLLAGPSQGQFLRARRHLDEGNEPRARAQIDLPIGNGHVVSLAVQLEKTATGMRLICLDQRPLADAIARADRLQLALEAVSAEDRTDSGIQRALLANLESAIVIVDVATGRILDLSKPAIALLAVSGDMAGSLSSGTAFTQCFEGRRRSEFIDSLCAAATANRSITADLRADRGEVTVRPRMTRANDAIILICDIDFAQHDGRTDGPAGLAALSQNSPDGMVCVDETGRITTMNEAFLRLVAAPSDTQLEGRSIVDFLLRGSIDFKAMIDPRRARTFNTRIVGLTGQRTAVEATVATLPGGGHGLVLRDITIEEASRSVAETVTPEGLQRPAVDPARQVGTVPLRDIVASMTDVIERDCVEAAIELTQNNRVAAAEMLGLSRQSLYVKLRKYGLLDNRGEDERPE